MLRRVTADVARGFAMGTADLVPGVSGATIAFVLGIYERLVTQLHTVAAAATQIVRGRFRAAQSSLRLLDWQLVVSVLAGVGLALIGLAGAVSWLIDNQAAYLSAAFFGLVAASALVALRSVTRFDALNVVLAVAVAAGSFVVLGLRAGANSDPSSALLFGGAAIAICATLLPGVSGAFVLLMLGLYEPFVDALADRNVGRLAVLAAGAAAGAAAFAPLLFKLLTHYRNRVLACIGGLMVGSLRVLWPWPAEVGELGSSGVDNTAIGAPVVGQLPLAAVLSLAAFAVVVLFQRAQPPRYLPARLNN